MHPVCVTIDVEDWFQVENLRPAFPRSVWDRQEWRVQRNVDRLLEILDEAGARATFFILGSVAEAFPGMARRIGEEGHEVASHGYHHQLLYTMRTSELKADLERSRKLLEDMTGREVRGYRAPSFSINDEIITHIREAGYGWDSSYNDFANHERYGSIALEKWSRERPGVYRRDGTAFREIPIRNLKTMGMNIPWGGGGYFRMIPWALFRAGIQNITAEDPYIFYIHPWEIDPGQPRTDRVPLGARIKHYTNLSKTEDRFRKLLEAFRPRHTLSQLVDER